MNSRDETDAFFMLLRAVGGENIEQEGNERAARQTRVAIDMNPSKEVWEKIRI